MTPLARFLSLLPFLGGCLTFWTISGMSDPPVPDAMQFKFSDKLMHAVAYACLAGLAAFGRRDGTRRQLFWFAAGLATGYGIVDELHQSLVDGRSATVSDVIADAIGAALGALAAVRLRERFQALGTQGWRDRRSTPAVEGEAVP